MNSALYFGTLRHRRFAPSAHAFSYRLYMAWIDLAELDQVFRGRWLWSASRPAAAWLRRADYLGDPAMPLDEAVRSLVARETGARPTGPIRMLTHLRSFGVSFNPVTFYYCHDAAGARVDCIVAEITNTPWNERHTYVLAASGSLPAGRGLRFRFGKRFHVSPFMPMEVDYDWRFSAPGERLAVHMENLRGGERCFDATLALRRREISGASLAAAMARHPVPPAAVLAAIYWQALRLWARGAPLHVHPRKLPGAPAP